MSRWVPGFLALLAASTACVTRVSRPSMHAIAYDSVTRQPLSGVRVTVTGDMDVVTDQDGQFSIPPRTYREIPRPFVEAPPLAFELRFAKDGYCQGDFSVHGRGGGSPGYTWHLEFWMQPLSSGRSCPEAIEVSSFEASSGCSRDRCEWMEQRTARRRRG